MVSLGNQRTLWRQMVARWCVRVLCSSMNTPVPHYSSPPPPTPRNSQTTTKYKCSQVNLASHGGCYTHFTNTDEQLRQGLHSQHTFFNCRYLGSPRLKPLCAGMVSRRSLHLRAHGSA